jgi:hypothetical protein
MLNRLCDYIRCIPTLDVFGDMPVNRKSYISRWILFLLFFTHDYTLFHNFVCTSLCPFTLLYEA